MQRLGAQKMSPRVPRVEMHHNESLSRKAETKTQMLELSSEVLSAKLGGMLSLTRFAKSKTFTHY